MTPTTESADLTPAEAATLANRSERTITRWIETGRLPARRRLGRLLIARADLEKLLVAVPAVEVPATAAG